MPLKKPYSKALYTLWLFAGSEVSILQNCKTDYNRHAGIGLVILMTCIFALFAGTYAGWYFSHNIAGAILFGTIWSLLIFSIDRTMVTSLKKTPGSQNWQAMLVQVSMRVVLGSLIAFIISIPVELLVFKDNIDIATESYKMNVLNEFNNIGSSALKTREDSARLVMQQNSVAKAEKRKAEDPQVPGFLPALKDSTDAAHELKRAQTKYTECINTVANAKANIPTDRFNNRIKGPEYSRWEGAKSRIPDAQKSVNKAKEHHAAMSNALAGIRLDWKVKQDSAIQWETALATKTKKRYDSSVTTINEKNDKMRSMQGQLQESFVVRFDILGFIADKDGNIQMFLWLIRILFFIIELLPSIVKLATPMGMYDYAMYHAEKDFIEVNLVQTRKLRELSAQQRVEKELKERGRQIDERLKQKGELHDRLVADAVKYQGEIATQIMQEWKRRQEEKIKSN